MSLGTCPHTLWKSARFIFGLSFLLFISACRPPAVTTTSQVTVQTGGVSNTIGDVTAVTTIYPQPRIEGCFATGPLPQATPTPPPSQLGWSAYGSSPQPGQCKFGDVLVGYTYQVDYSSAQCNNIGVGTLRTWVTPDAHGNTPPVTVCTVPDSILTRLDTHFARTGQLPPTVTFITPGLTSTYGFPRLLVYDSGGNMVGKSTAVSVATDGSNATFPFPRTSSGTNLTSGMYMFAVQNFGANGSYKIPDATHFTVGQDSSMNSPYGVDAINITVETVSCSEIRCFNSTRALTQPLVTLYNTNQLSYGGSSIAVGSRPVMVKAFRNAEVVTSDDTFTSTATGPSLALVVNQGSDNVSVVDLNRLAVTNTVAVGSQPIALAIKPDETKAYVANYGSGSITEVDLATFQAGRTIQLGNAPMSMAIDPAGIAVWVGGQGYLSKVDLSSFTVISSVAVNGAVTSLAASTKQNELVFSVIGNTSASSSQTYSAGNASTSTYSVTELSLSTMTATGSYNPASSGSYATYSMNGTLPNPAANPGATQISQQWNNGMGISATPTGFVIYDLTNHAEIMRGTTSTPIRGIASDPKNWFVYLTLPDSNDLITIPLPH